MDRMESVRCYLCDHEFVEGEEPWLMFEQRLREDGQVECSLAELLGAILQKDLQEDVTHSTLLCDSCNADVLEYESLKTRFSEIRERILNSYQENSTIQTLDNLIHVTTIDESLPFQVDENSKLIITPDDIDNLSNSEYIGITDMDVTDMVEEVHDEEGDNEVVDANVNIIGSDNMPNNENDAFIDNVNSEILTDNLDFAAFNEHVAQNSLPSGVLNLSDSLVNLEVCEKPIEVVDIPLDRQGDDLNFIISTDIFENKDNIDEPSESNAYEAILTNSDKEEDASDQMTPEVVVKPVCKKDGDIFICLICEISPQFDYNMVLEHFQRLHNSKMYMCEKCPEGFGKRLDLKAHIENGHIISCENCERTFTSMRQYRIHKRVHYGSSKPFKCPVCQKMYVSKTILEEHMNTHTGVRPFRCTECPKDFASRYTLQTHMKIHKERPRPYQCDLCEKRFLNQQNLNQHKKLHVSEKAFQCDVCNKAFTTQHSLQVHKIVHSGQRPFICRICGKSFARRPEIKDHERIHTGEKPFKCEFCPMAFAQRTNLASHRKSTHLNEKLHKCEICLRSFKRKRLLDYHIQAIHTGERPHKCNICGAGFVYPEHYKKHMLIHSGTKPYACEVCFKQFNSRDNRNAHRFVHSDKKPYECVECGAGFMRKPLLLSHMKQAKHLSDTIIVNQPQFTQQQTGTSLSTVTVSVGCDHSQEEESEIDVDNDLQTQEVSDEALVKMIFKTEEMLTENDSVSSITDKDVNNDEKEMTSVPDHLIKDDLDDVKYLEFDENGQSLAWVDIGGVDKI